MNAITFAARLSFLFALFLLYGTREGLSMWEKQRVACRLFAREGYAQHKLPLCELRIPTERFSFMGRNFL